MSFAQENVGVDAEGQPLPPMIGEDIITQMRERLAETKGKIVVEVKAQRLADTHGVHGWKAVEGNKYKFFPLKIS